MRAQPLFSRHVRLLMAIEHRRHDFALPPQRELQVVQQPSQVRALLTQAGARDRVDRCSAEVGAESGIAAGQVLDLEAEVHRVRVPRHEHERLVHAIRPLELGEHALLAGLDEPEMPEAERVRPDHAQHQAVGGRARLDAVDRRVERACEFLDGREVLQTRVIEVLRDRQGEFGFFEVRTYDLDGMVGEVGFTVGLLGRHPVAQEHVDVAVLEGCENDRDRQVHARRRIAESCENLGRNGGNGCHIRETDHSEANGTAFRGLCGCADT